MSVRPLHAPQPVTSLRILGQIHLVCETQRHESLDEGPAEVDLTTFQAKACGLREGVVVAMESFAKGDQPECGQVVALNCNIIDAPALVAVTVSEMANQPVAGKRNRDTHCDPPHQPAPAADGIIA
jgi:hypothetical protein